MHDPVAFAIRACLAARSFALDVEDENNLHQSWLHIAAAAGAAATCEILIQNGAPLGEEDALGRTPEDWATGDARDLLSAGADVPQTVASEIRLLENNVPEDVSHRVVTMFRKGIPRLYDGADVN